MQWCMVYLPWARSSNMESTDYLGAMNLRENRFLPPFMVLASEDHEVAKQTALTAIRLSWQSAYIQEA